MQKEEKQKEKKKTEAKKGKKIMSAVGFEPTQVAL
jgi:hypothetical protein